MMESLIFSIRQIRKEKKNENRNLYLFSCNNLYKINQFFLSRPGRIFYHFKFDSLSSEVIQEYLKDNLKVQIDTNISQFIKTSKLQP